MAPPPLASMQRRHVHERPFVDLPEDVTKGEAYAAARDALLQLNLMVRRGIEPDALMYTSLIATMGRAGLEWQAYKLFSRMIEQDVRPLPETYVALRDATSKQRRSLREQIQEKIEESMDAFPQQLAEDELARQKEEDRLCIAKFNEYVRGELPPTTSPVPAEARTAAAATAEATPAAAAAASEGGSAPVATMRIRNPTDAWNTAQMAEEVRAAPHRFASGETVKDLQTKLAALHEEELRIYLAANRQLRHGSKEELIQRIVAHVNERHIKEMLARRHHYFRSVQYILGNDLRELHMRGGAAAPTTPTTSEKRSPEADRTLAEGERASIAAEVLQAPWGILRKPVRRQAEAPAPPNAARLERIRLSEPELFLVRHKAEVKELDELPESLLRRYAHQFHLRWRRQVPNSLLDAVQWHVTTFFAVEDLEKGGRLKLLSPSPTPAVRLQKEAEGMQQTLENYEAFRIISQRTNNLQVVDNKEINLHLKRVQREARQKDRRMEKTLRREKNILAAAGLASAAMSYSAPLVEDAGGPSHVLGWSSDEPGATSSLPPSAEEGEGDEEEGESPTSTTTMAAAADTESPSEELPPWELFAGEDEFNLSTGHFGDPTVGRYQELSDSKIKVLPSRAAQKKWSVDEHLLPSRLQDVVQEAKLEQQQRHEAIEREYHEKLQYKRYKKWDTFLQKAQKKNQQRTQEEEEAEEVKPLPPQRRMAQLLRKGSQRQKVSEEQRARYNKSL